MQRFLRAAYELRMVDELVDIEMKLCRFISQYHSEYCTQDWYMAVSEFRTVCNVLNLTAKSLAPNTQNTNPWLGPESNIINSCIIYRHSVFLCVKKSNKEGETSDADSKYE
jgi:hypothetical protein